MLGIAITEISVCMLSTHLLFFTFIRLLLEPSKRISTKTQEESTVSL